MRCLSGNTLNEYGLMLGTVALVSIGALSMLGGNVSNLFKSMESPPVADSLQRMSNLDFGGGTTGASHGSLAGIGALPNQALMANPNGLDKNVTSAEGNLIGNQALQLDAVLRAIQADPNHDPAIVALVTDLANKGHLTGTKLQSAFASYKVLGVQGSETIYSATFAQAYEKYYMQSAAFTNSYNNLNQYLASHPQVLPPDLQEQLSSASTQIKDFSSSLIGANGVLQANFVAAKNDPYAVKTVHQDANTVCESGGNESLCAKP